MSSWHRDMTDWWDRDWRNDRDWRRDGYWHYDQWFARGTCGRVAEDGKRGRSRETRLRQSWGAAIDRQSSWRKPYGQVNLPSEPVVAMYLGEVKFFLEDMKCSLAWWICAVDADIKLVRGDEDVNVTQNVLELVEGSEYTRCQKFVVFPRIVWESHDARAMQLIEASPCRQGRVHVFPFAGGVSAQALWGAFNRHLQSTEPSYCVRVNDVDLLVRNAVLIPVYTCGKSGTFLFTVFVPEKRKTHWAFLGGDVCFGKDRGWYDAVRREWDEEAGMLLGFTRNEAFSDDLPSLNTHVRAGPLSSSLFVHLAANDEGICSQHPCTAYLFARATDRFYHETKTTQKMPMPDDGRYARWDGKDADLLRKVHSEGYLFVECDQCCWQAMENFDAGYGRDGRKIRNDNAQLIQQRKWACSDFTWFTWMTSDDSESFC